MVMKITRFFLFPLILLMASLSSASVAAIEVPVSDLERTAPSPAKSTSTLLPFVELYTSQACPRCPKANQRFTEFANDQSVIAVSFPVDIWDFMGWQDTYAQKSFSDRQKSINTQLGRRGPYTPQAIFNGEKHCSAIKEKSMVRRLKETKNAPDLISVRYDGTTLNVEGNETPLEIWVVNFIPGLTYETPKAGQNSNKTLEYHNRVTQISTPGVISTTGEEIKAGCKGHCAIVFQEPNFGPILGAIRYSETVK